MKTEIKLGMRVKDKVTDFVGIAVARVTYLNGCVQIQVTPKVESGKIVNQWIDEIQLEVVDRGILPEEKEKKKSLTSGTISTKGRLSTARNYRRAAQYGGMRSHPSE